LCISVHLFDDSRRARALLHHLDQTKEFILVFNIPCVETNVNSSLFSQIMQIRTYVFIFEIADFVRWSIESMR
jgi:hypothetical protein